MSSPPVFIGVRVTRSLVLHVSFVDRCLSFCTFSFGHCVVCPSSIYQFWKSLNLVTLTILETVTELINWTVNEFINFRIYLILAFINKKWHSGNTFSRNYRRNSRILPDKIKIYLRVDKYRLIKYAKIHIILKIQSLLSLRQSSIP